VRKSSGSRWVGLMALALAGLLASVLAGTVLAAPGDITAAKVREINPTDSSGPENLANLNGIVYFSADDGTNGEELWKSDGTAAGTTMIDDDVVPNGGINPGADGSEPDDLTNINGTLYFQADDGTNGSELWKSDGTPAGTVMVEDAIPGGGIAAGASGSSPDGFTNVGGTVFFRANDQINGFELWKTDGTPSGTTIVEDAVPAGGIRPGANGSSPSDLTNVNGTLFFNADDGTNGAELWKSDGTPSGTTIVEDAVPGGGISSTPDASAGSFPGNLTVVNGLLFFSASDQVDGFELWRSDGTPSGTFVVEDAVPGGGIGPGTDGSTPQELEDVNGILFFAADDGTNGTELWRSDGTPEGTTIVEDAVPGGGLRSTPAPASSSFPDDLENVNGTVFFAAEDGNNGTEAWKSDGTPAGTLMVKDGIPGSDGSSPQFFTNAGGVAFFQAVDNTNGIELWKSDGTSPGTTVVEDAIPGGGLNSDPTPLADSEPDHLTNVNGTLFFTAEDSSNNIELWKTVIEPTPPTEPTTTTSTPVPASAPTPTPAPTKKKCKKKKKHNRSVESAKKKCKKKKKH
jgi:ELWxxDGT repeat protein